MEQPPAMDSEDQPQEPPAMPRQDHETAASAARPRGIRSARVQALVLVAIAASVLAVAVARACRPGASSSSSSSSSIPAIHAAGTPPAAGSRSGAGSAGSSRGEGAAGRTGPAGAGEGKQAAAATGTGGAARERRTLARSFATAGVRRLLLDFPPGAIRVEPAAGEAARVTVEVECEPGCAAASRLRLDSASEGGGTLRLYLDGWPQGPPWSQPAGGLREEVHVRAPRRLALGADLGPCSLDLSRLDGPWSLVSAGLHLRVEAAEASAGAARLATYWGDTMVLTSRGRRDGRGLLGSGLTWRRGRPGAELGVECVFGSVELALGPEREPRLPPAIRRPG
jgi:hypothetical protein